MENQQPDSIENERTLHASESQTGAPQVLLAGLSALTSTPYQASSSGYPAVTVFEDGTAGNKTYYLGIIVSVQVPPDTSTLNIDYSFAINSNSSIISVTAIVDVSNISSSSNPYKTFGHIYTIPSFGISAPSITATIELKTHLASYPTYSNLTGVFQPANTATVIPSQTSLSRVSVNSNFVNTPFVAVNTSNNSNQIDVLLLLPDLPSGVQTPVCSYYPTYPGQQPGITVAPIVISGIQASSQSTSQLFVFHISLPYPFNAVHTRLDYPTDSTGGDGDPGGGTGSRGTYVAVQKPPTLPISTQLLPADESLEG